MCPILNSQTLPLFLFFDRHGSGASHQSAPFYMGYLVYQETNNLHVCSHLCFKTSKNKWGEILGHPYKYEPVTNIPWSNLEILAPTVMYVSPLSTHVCSWGDRVQAKALTNMPLCAVTVLYRLPWLEGLPEMTRLSIVPGTVLTIFMSCPSHH